MDDLSLNRAVAEARHPWDETKCRVCGWPIVADDEPGCWQSNCSMRPPPKQRADAPADVVHSPAAWGALHDQLRAEGWRVEITSGASLTTVLLRRWGPGPKKEVGEGVDSLTGRALALAYLKSKGVLL